MADWMITRKEPEPEDAVFCDAEDALMYVLMKYTDMEAETIYSIVFNDGGKINWH